MYWGATEVLPKVLQLLCCLELNTFVVLVAFWCLQGAQPLYWGATEEGQLLLGSHLDELEGCSPTATAFPPGRAMHVCVDIEVAIREGKEGSGDASCVIFVLQALQSCSATCLVLGCCSLKVETSHKVHPAPGHNRNLHAVLLMIMALLKHVAASAGQPKAAQWQSECMKQASQRC